MARNLNSSLFTLHSSLFTLSLLSMAMITSCARMGAPDGGWYDETPPRVIGASPAERETGVTQKRVSIYFDEYIKLENASEKVVISPPQKEQPEIKTQGKRITINLIDSLKPNTTYTIDFSDAIVDNNEGNPMGNYTYSFSTGEQIDTMECSGYVLNAEDLEPVKGILVGLLDTARADTAKAFLRVSRTDSQGHFVIRGVKAGAAYHVGAVQDMDDDHRFSSRAELMAFSDRLITPSSFLDHRQDTVWLDELHIKDIKRTAYTHFMPDDIVLRLFMHEQTDRFFLKHERNDAENFSLFFTAPIHVDSLKRFAGNPAIGQQPQLRLLNAPDGINAGDWYVCEHYAGLADTLTYWLRDTLLVNQDTLLVEMTTLQTDTLGMLQIQTDTLEVLAKTPYARRMKQQKEEYDNWRKDIDKQIRQREKIIARLDPETEASLIPPEIDTIMPPVRLKPRYNLKQQIDPDGVVGISFEAPMLKVDTSAVHLYVEQDSMWFRAPVTIFRTDTLPSMRNWQLYSEWIPGARYSLEVDTLAFEDIYGHTSEPYKAGIMIGHTEDYASLFVNVTPAVFPHDKGNDSTSAVKPQIIVQLLNNGDGVVRSATVVDGTAELYYLAAGTYYLRAIVDRNGNGKWDTGDYYNNVQPEEVYYYHEPVECKAKWDYTKQWNLTGRSLYLQKPAEITKQKGEKKKEVKHRNAERAKELGIAPPDK